MVTDILFQTMFAATAATIVSGALAERIRYRSYIVCAVVISSFVYAVFGSWAWGSLDGLTDGWLKSSGFFDFAGSTVVHSIGGWSAFAGVPVMGARIGRFGADRKPREVAGHNLVGAVAVHGFGGAWGILMVSFCLTVDENAMPPFLVQGLGVLMAFVWAFGIFWIIFQIISQIMGLRGDSREERRGLDYAEHYEISYPEFQQDALHDGKRVVHRGKYD